LRSGKIEKETKNWNVGIRSLDDSFFFLFFFYFYWLCILGQRLCIDFSLLRAHFLTTLRLALDIICSRYFWSNLEMNIVVGWFGLVMGIINTHGLARAKLIAIVVVFHKKG